MSSSWISPELATLGLTTFFRQQLLQYFSERGDEASLSVPGRVVCERRGEYQVGTAGGVVRGMLRGRLLHELSSEERPAVGDWVLLEPAEPVGRIAHVLDRQTMLRRRTVGGSSHGQALAANVDLCFVVSALCSETADRHAARRALNVRRIERYLLVARESRIPPVILVNKADLSARGEAAIEALLDELPDVEAKLVSAETGQGLEWVRERLEPGATAVLLGSSGVGKSALINRLLGHRTQRTGAVRDQDARGRHTTTERQLLLLPDGGVVIDTPGMRELALWADANADPSHFGFADIDALAVRCRFRDCTHRSEPGCAVLAAIEDGTLAASRLENSRKLERELLVQKTRVDVRLRQEQRKRSRALSRAARARTKAKTGGQP